VNQKDAMREAHRLVSVLINQAQSTAAEGWADDEADHQRINTALTVIARRHERAAGITAPSLSGGDA
jgi:hypothetical protein